MELLDHRGRPIEPAPAPPRRGPGFVPSAPTAAARPAIDGPADVLSPAIGFEIEAYENDDNEEDRRAPVRVAPRYPQIHFGNGDGQTQVLKSDRRKKTALMQNIRVLAARIPDAEALEAIAHAIPRENRAHFLRAIKPLLKFKTAE